jgi:hypothetical protein
MGMPASQLKQLREESNDYPGMAQGEQPMNYDNEFRQALDKKCMQPFEFMLRAKVDNWNESQYDGNQVRYSVIKQVSHDAKAERMHLLEMIR